MASVTLDRIDRRLLGLLQRNNRRRLRDLADEIGISAPTCLRRMRRLETSGVVTVQSPGDGDFQGPPTVVLHIPKITCPMVMVAADPEIDSKFVIPPPTDITFTIRSVAPTACR